jgi:methyl-accepting chemotaxis protein
MNFSNLAIGKRMALAFGLVMALMAVIAAAGFVGLREVSASVQEINADRFPKVKIANAIGDLVSSHSRKLRTMLLMESAADRDKEMAIMADQRAEIGKLYSTLEARLNTEEGKKLFAKLLKERTDYVHEVEAIAGLVRADDLAHARESLFSKLRKQETEYLDTLDEFSNLVEGQMTKVGERAGTDVTRADTIILVATAVGLLMAAGFGWVATRSVTQPVAQAVDALGRLAAGDLTVRIDSGRTDELGKMLQAVSATAASLRQVVEQVRSGVDSVTTASSQIAAGNTDLSGRTEQQASSLQETASSMEQLTSTVRASADNARQANQLAAATSDVAARGGQVVGEVIATMDAINHSSKKIADIIGVIDGIAFQTNILALNAAVEAARAGEQGRGFAVVASEVRSLAQRSAEAAKEIKSLIGSSVERVDAGSRQVAAAGETMEQIVTQVRRVTDLIGEIASAAQEQSSGISQVNQAVTQMDQVTQQNAALVEESAAAAQSLAQQAAALAAAVGIFKIGQEHALQ